ncbi:MAG: DUF6273 domain-containing protein, partial [Anaerovoracaceae bacterium]
MKKIKLGRIGFAGLISVFLIATMMPSISFAADLKVPDYGNGGFKNLPTATTPGDFMGSDILYFGQYGKNKAINAAAPQWAAVGVGSVPEEPIQGKVYKDKNGQPFVYNATTGTYFQYQPIKWRVLTAKDGNLSLLSDQVISGVPWHNDNDSAITWANSDIRAFLNGENSIQEYSFKDVAFTASEEKALQKTLIYNAETGDPGTDPNDLDGEESRAGGVKTLDKIYLPSYADVNNKKLFNTINDLPTTATEYALGLGVYQSAGASKASPWWLRTPGYNIPAPYTALHMTDLTALNPGADSGLYEDELFNNQIGVRPITNINLNEVAFVSTAAGAGAKSSPKNGNGGVDGALVKNTPVSNEKILTLKDSNLKLASVSISDFVVDPDSGTSGKMGSFIINYTGATIGEKSDRYYLSAMITDKTDGSVKYYGTFKSLDSKSKTNGTATIDIPVSANTDVPNGKLQIFVEQKNDDYYTDYAGEPLEVLSPIPVKLTPSLNPLKIAGGSKISEKILLEQEAKALKVNNTALTDGSGSVPYPGEAGYDESRYIAALDLAIENAVLDYEEYGWQRSEDGGSNWISFNPHTGSIPATMNGNKLRFGVKTSVGTSYTNFIPLEVSGGGGGGDVSKITVSAKSYEDTNMNLENSLVGAVGGVNTVPGEGNYVVGTVAWLEAFANPGYKFIEWRDNSNNIVSTNSRFSFT